jgi:hypothetical protein
MKIYFIILWLLLHAQIVFAQKIVNYKVATAENKIQRSAILDALRVRMYKEFQQEFLFTVNTLNVLDKYAWVAVEVMRKDGKEIVFKPHEAPFMDCCHTEALLVKKKNKWIITEYAAFSTDVWFANAALFKKYKLSPKIAGLNF